jgi:hypothetical protein
MNSINKASYMVVSETPSQGTLWLTITAIDEVIAPLQ